MNRKLLLWLPFGLCAALFVMFFVGLRHPEDHVIASQVVGKALPEFVIDAPLAGQPGLATADYKDGTPRLINIFASWCVPCAQEVPMLVRLKAMGAQIDGIAVHDAAPELDKFLGTYGNPYRRIGMDNAGKAQIAFGSAGVPETFLVDGKGRIIYQHIGVVTEADLPKLMTMLEQAK
jgi:cytochrome c biogenesis protein CcmG/thiol:disulfide interchange protein DsbE